MRPFKPLLLSGVVLCTLLLTSSAQARNLYRVYGRVMASEPMPAGNQGTIVDLLESLGLALSEVLSEPGDVAVAPLAMVRVEVRHSDGQVLASTIARTSGYYLEFGAGGAFKATVKIYDPGSELELAEFEVPLTPGANRRYFLVQRDGIEVGTEIEHPEQKDPTKDYIFSRVGRILTDDIFGGLASSPKAAWDDAPFGGTLDLFGAARFKFYQPNADNYCYKVLANGKELDDPLYKVRHVLESKNGLLEYSSNRQKMGPFGDAGGNCYRFTQLYGQQTGGQQVYWSNPDLLMRWNSAKDIKAADGETHVDLTLQIYQRNGNQWSALNPIGGELDLTVDNRPVKGSLSLLIDDGQSTQPPSACGIVHLNLGSQLKVLYDVSHDSLANYELTLSNASNQQSQGGSYAGGTFTGDSGSLSFAWGQGIFTSPCIYSFELSAAARTTNGYGIVYRYHKSRSQYVAP